MGCEDILCTKLAHIALKEGHRFNARPVCPVSQALGSVLTDRLGPAMVFLLGSLLALSTNFLPLLVRDVREMK